MHILYYHVPDKQGWGLFAGEQIEKGSFIMQYIGEVFFISSKIGQKRT